MGMFNNSSGEESPETVSSMTIPVEIKEKTSDITVYYYQANDQQVQKQVNILRPENTSASFSPDTGMFIFPLRNIKVREFLFSGFRFSRPPPSVC